MANKSKTRSKAESPPALSAVEGTPSRKKVKKPVGKSKKKVRKPAKKSPKKAKKRTPKKSKKSLKKDIVKTEKEQKETKRGNPQWEKGVSGNPAGRPKGSKERDFMLEAKLEVEATKKKSIYKHAFERAFKNDRVLIAMLKKLVPDMAYIESDAAQSLADIFAIMMGK